MKHFVQIGSLLPVAWALALWAACNGDIGTPSRDAATKDGPRTDAPAEDASTDWDAWEVSDAGVPDGEPADALPPDAEPDAGPPANRFGIGLVGPGNVTQWDLTANLVGTGGYIKLIFPGIDLNLTQVPQDWVNAVAECYNRDLIPVIRMGPPWGNRKIREQADDPSATSFLNLASKYAMVVRSLPLRPGWPLYVEVHNEPNLCYEWDCSPGHVPNDRLTYQQMAAEYAAFLRDVADALHAIGDSRIKVLNGALAPGGAGWCACGSDDWGDPLLGTHFLTAMAAAVPDIWDRLDGFATHSYPSTQEGSGFWRPYDQCMPGLLYFEHELQTIGRNLPVFITETGWPVTHDACGGQCGTREQVADWTVQAYRDPWLSHPSIRAVMPFMLQDPNWDAFAWVAPDGSHYPVYDAVRAFRCSLGVPPPCSP